MKLFSTKTTLALVLPALGLSVLLVAGFQNTGDHSVFLGPVLSESPEDSRSTSASLLREAVRRFGQDAVIEIHGWGDKPIDRIAFPRSGVALVTAALMAICLVGTAFLHFCRNGIISAGLWKPFSLLSIAWILAWGCADAAGRWAGQFTISRESPAIRVWSPGGRSRNLGFSIRLLQAQLEHSTMLTARFHQSHLKRQLTHAIVATPGNSLILWPGPGQTSVEVTQIAYGQRVINMVPGDGPPALHLAWPTRQGDEYSTWIMLGYNTLTDPEKRLRLRFRKEAHAATIEHPGPPLLDVVRDPDGRIRALYHNAVSLETGGSSAETPRQVLGPTLKVPVTLPAGNVQLEIKEYLRSGSRPIPAVQLNRTDSSIPLKKTALLRVHTAEAERQVWVLYDDHGTALHTDGARITLETGLNPAALGSSVDLEILDTKARVIISGRASRLKPFRWRGYCFYLGTALNTDKVTLAVFYRPWPTTVGLVGTGILGIAAIVSFVLRQRDRLRS